MSKFKTNIKIKFSNKIHGISHFSINRFENLPGLLNYFMTSIKFYKVYINVSISMLFFVILQYRYNYLLEKFLISFLRLSARISENRSLYFIFRDFSWLSWLNFTKIIFWIRSIFSVLICTCKHIYECKY